MAGSADHIKALVRSHAAGDDDSFYAVAMQVAAREARLGHNRLAEDLKQTIDASRRQPVARAVTSIAQPQRRPRDSRRLPRSPTRPTGPRQSEVCSSTQRSGRH